MLRQGGKINGEQDKEIFIFQKKKDFEDIANYDCDSDVFSAGKCYR